MWTERWRLPSLVMDNEDGEKKGSREVGGEEAESGMGEGESGA